MELGVADKDEGGTNLVWSDTTLQYPLKDDSDDEELELVSCVALPTPSWSLGPSKVMLSRPEPLRPAVPLMTLALSLLLALDKFPCSFCRALNCPSSSE